MTILDIQPGKLDLKLYGGDDVPIVVNLVNAAGEAVTVDGILKATVYAPYATPSTRTPTITAESTAGQYTILFDKTLTRAYAGLGDLAWDLQLVNSSSKVRTILNGLVTISVEVTND